MARRIPWWSVRVELVGGGRVGALWPRPGRIFAVSTRHTFHMFAEAIDDAFARWDRSHRHEFELASGLSVTEFRSLDGEEDPDQQLDAEVVALGDILKPGDEFGYTFDLGDDWRHRCVIAPDELAVRDLFRVAPSKPSPYWGWGSIPDAGGRLWESDDAPAPPAPEAWPWPDPPPPALVTLHSPGAYTLTRAVTADDPLA